MTRSSFTAFYTRTRSSRFLNIESTGTNVPTFYRSFSVPVLLFGSTENRPITRDITISTDVFSSNKNCHTGDHLRISRVDCMRHSLLMNRLTWELEWGLREESKSNFTIIEPETLANISPRRPYCQHNNNMHKN